MRFKRKCQIEKGKLDVTPLVDVVFLLLIFFMLSSSFIMQPGIKVDLPNAVKSEPNQLENIIVTLTQENQVYFNNERIALKGLKRRIRRTMRKSPLGTLIIKADTNSRHGSVVEVMNIARQAGVEKIAIATKSKSVNE